MEKLKAAVIGLGNIGFQFDMDPLRKGTWSHVSAYSKCKKTVLAGAVETDKDKRLIFKKHFRGDVPVFQTVDELMKNIAPDVVSICTPTRTHCRILKRLVKYPVKAIFCEKPIAETADDAAEMVRICQKHGIILAVNHTRRWDDNYLFVKKCIHDGKIGNVKAVNAFYTGQIFNIGTHLFDTIRMLIQKDALVVSGICPNINNPDPDVSGWIEFESGIPCTIITTGRKRDIVFEIDIIGEEGRARITQNGERVEMHSFVTSESYSDYRELLSKPVRAASKRDRFIEAINDICLVVEGRKTGPECSGKDAIAALNISISISESAKRNKPIKIRGVSHAL